MSLDGALPGFVLKRDPRRGQIDLVDRHDSRKVVYSAFRDPGPSYSCVLEDALFQSPLARCTAPSAQAREKKLALFNPDSEVTLKLVGRLGFSWQFEFQGETYEYRQPKLSSREFTLFLLRHPDPPVDLARFLVHSPSSSRADGSGAEISVQQYNLDRFHLKDPKGLEVLLLLGFCGFWDALEDRAGGGKPFEGPKTQSGSGTVTQSAVPSPVPPPVPKQETDELIGWQDYEDPPNPNEVLLSHQPVMALAERAFNLLKDSSMLFIVLKARTPDEIVKGVKVVEEIGRLRLRRWEELESGEELYQYIVEEKASSPPSPRPVPLPPAGRQPPRIINLDDPAPSASSSTPPSETLARSTSVISQPWDTTPPQAMSFYLSKIVLPDLQPRTSSSSLSPAGESLSPHLVPAPPPRRASPSSASTDAASAHARLSPTPGSTASFHPPAPPPPSPSLSPAPKNDPGDNSRLGRLRDGFGRLGLKGPRG